MAPCRLRVPLASENGVTLVELMVAMTVLAVGVTVAFQALLSTTVNTSARLTEVSDLQTELRGAVDALASELRGAQCNNTTLPVTTATGTQLTFTSPDRAGTSTFPPGPYRLRQISYRLASGSLDRQFATSTNDSSTGPPWTWGATSAWRQRVGSVTNTTAFTYKDANGNATTTASAVASALVSLTVKPRAGLGGTAVSYQTTVDLRTPTCS